MDSATWCRTPAAAFLQAAKGAGDKLGVQLHTAPVQTLEDLDAAFAMAAQERVDGILSNRRRSVALTAPLWPSWH
jgi:hypothetical protein